MLKVILLMVCRADTWTGDSGVRVHPANHYANSRRQRSSTTRALEVGESMPLEHWKTPRRHRAGRTKEWCRGQDQEGLAQRPCAGKLGSPWISLSSYTDANISTPATHCRVASRGQVQLIHGQYLERCSPSLSHLPSPLTGSTETRSPGVQDPSLFHFFFF